MCLTFKNPKYSRPKIRILFLNKRTQQNIKRQKIKRNLNFTFIVRIDLFIPRECFYDKKFNDFYPTFILFKQNPSLHPNVRSSSNSHLSEIPHVDDITRIYLLVLLKFFQVLKMASSEQTVHKKGKVIHHAACIFSHFELEKGYIFSLCW